MTKSRCGGGEGLRAGSLPPPTLHVKRNNLFILGFKNPSLLSALLGPSSLPLSLSLSLTLPLPYSPSH